MDGDSWRLRILWWWPQLPKKKIRKFIKLGDEYFAKGNTALAAYCYERSWDLANSIRAVYFTKKIEDRVADLSLSHRDL